MLAASPGGHVNAPSARKIQPLQDSPNQDCVDGMQQDVNEVVTEWFQPPEHPLNAERAVNQREMLRLGVRGKPDLPPAIGGREQGVFRHILVVLPDKTGPQSGQVGQQYQSQEQDGRQGGAARPPRPRIWGSAGAQCASTR